MNNDWAENEKQENDDMTLIVLNFDDDSPCILMKRAINKNHAKIHMHKRHTLLFNIWYCDFRHL